MKKIIEEILKVLVFVCLTLSSYVVMSQSGIYPTSGTYCEKRIEYGVDFPLDASKDYFYRWYFDGLDLPELSDYADIVDCGGNCGYCEHYSEGGCLDFAGQIEVTQPNGSPTMTVNWQETDKYDVNRLPGEINVEVVEGSRDPSGFLNASRVYHYSLDITRFNAGPPNMATLDITPTGNITLENGQATVTFTYDDPSNVSTRRFTGMQAELVGGGFTSVSFANGNSMSYTLTSTGQKEFEIYFTNECNTQYGPYTRIVNVAEGCEGLDEDFATLSVSGIPFDNGGYLVESGTTYTVDVATDYSDFADQYEIQHDGGTDVVVDASNNTFVVSAELISFDIWFDPKPGFELCQSVMPISIFVGGQDLIVERFCDIVIPDDLPDFDIDLDPDDPVLEHFALTLKSNRTIAVKPGLTLISGAEIFLEPGTPIANPESDFDHNFIQSNGYNEYGELLSSSRVYFDGLGRATQSQYKDLSDNMVLASENIFDDQGRAVLSTLSAPVWAAMQPEDEGCITRLPGANLVYNYKDNFITTGGEPYTHEAFDGANELSPLPVDDSEEGTLGWYYGHNNGSGENENFNELTIATTDYPYSRTLFHNDGTEEAKGSTRPGDAYRAGGGILAITDKEGVLDSDIYLTEYRRICQDEIGLEMSAEFEGNYQKAIGIDEDGKKSVVYSDRSGKTLITLYYGTLSIPQITSYQFYDHLGRTIVSISPNGVAAYNKGNGMLYADLDKTVYEYDSRGRLARTIEPDAGITEYIYRNDGNIRFSQNAKQRIDGRYSYTHYDYQGRVIDVGEFLPGATGLVFDRTSTAMANALEEVGVAAMLSSGTHFDRVQTTYDVGSSQWQQNNLEGRISSVCRQNSSCIYFSYDYLGRIEMIGHAIPELGSKKIDYIYGADGNVIQASYQLGVAEEEFNHFYHYDQDGILTDVYTSTDINESLTLRAHYDYYAHGPLKRVEYGDHLQGIDYVYTADGKLKSINDADPNRDPGEDDPMINGFGADQFGMSLTYYTGDYQGADHDASSMKSLTHPDLYNGNIKANAWTSPVLNGSTIKGYAYKYDDRNQLSEADFGQQLVGDIFMKDADRENEVRVLGYDANGNIENLTRRGPSGGIKHTLDYHYDQGTNQLSEVELPGATRDYEYNDMGQLEYGYDFENDRYYHVKYDVTGKVLGVYRYDFDGDIYTSDRYVTFTYSPGGFRLSKTTYDIDNNPASKTWYVRDITGLPMAIYHQDILRGSPVAVQEFPVYGSSRIGTYKPASNTNFYEIQDHLGNVRVVIGDPKPLGFLATMEISESTEEEAYFTNLAESRTSVPSFLNHTKNIEAGNAIRLNNVRAGEEQSVGPTISLAVNPGDTIRTDVYVKYIKPYENNASSINALIMALPSLSGTTILTEQSIGSSNTISNFFPLPQDMEGKGEDVPRAYLNYIVFDAEMNQIDAGFQRVSEAAAIPMTNPELHTHELLSEEIIIEQKGYIYIYVSNSSTEEVEVFFDDFGANLLASDIVVANDYYPFGLPHEQIIKDEEYRWGFQGQYAEKDKETGWSSFELRQYDPVIGRFTTIDPYSQFYSPYLGMGNSPVNGVDPDGGFFNRGTNPNSSGNPFANAVKLIKGWFSNLFAPRTFSNDVEDYNDQEVASEVRRVSKNIETITIVGNSKPYYSFAVGKQGNESPFLPDFNFEVTYYDGKFYYGPGVDYTVGVPGWPSISFSHGYAYGDPSGFDINTGYGSFFGAEFGTPVGDNGGKFGVVFTTAPVWVSGSFNYSDNTSGYQKTYNNIRIRNR